MYILLAFTAFASCGSDKTIEEIQEITKDGTDPLRFGKISETTSSATRASSDLTSDFMVSTYKAYNKSSQQVVMDKYIVKYSVDGWNNTSKWDYTGVEGQIERYWDYENFPYRFHAIAPCPTSKEGFTLNDKSILIPTPFKYQTVVDGNVSPADTEAEPYMVAQVERGTDGIDKDIFDGGTQIGDENSSTTLNRRVALPFHHLNSKVRFGVYSLKPWATANKTYIQDLVIKVSSNNFVTAAGKYQISDKSSSWKVVDGNSGFLDLSKATTTGTVLFRFNGLDSTNQPLEDNDLRKHQGQSSAYMMDCKTGIMQIPQENVQMTASLILKKEDGTDLKTYSDVPIVLVLPDETKQNKFNWVSGNIYTYYLILDFDNEKLEIQFTATLAPWEDISGSLSTDLEK